MHHVSSFNETHHSGFPRDFSWFISQRQSWYILLKAAFRMGLMFHFVNKKVPVMDHKLLWGGGGRKPNCMRGFFYWCNIPQTISTFFCAILLFLGRWAAALPAVHSHRKHSYRLCSEPCREGENVWGRIKSNQKAVREHTVRRKALQSSLRLSLIIENVNLD